MDTSARRIAQGVALGGIAVVGFFLLVQLVVYLREILAIIFLGFIVGITLLPVTERASGVRIPRVVAVLLIYGALAGVLSLFLWYAIPQLVAEVENVVEQLDEIEAWYGDLAATFGLPTLEELSGYIGTAVEALLPELAQQAMVALTVIAYVLSIFVVALFVTINQQQMRDTVLSVVPARSRARWDEFMASLGSKLRRYVFATLVNMTLVGIITYIGLTILGIPFAFLLAVLAFLFEVLPIVGPWIAFVPALGIALTEGIFEAIAVSIFYLAVQQFESYVLVPVVYGRGTKAPNLLLLLAIMIGFPLMGVLGAIIALPVSLMLYAFTTEVLIPWRRRRIEIEAVPVMSIAAEDAAALAASANEPRPASDDG